MISTFTIWLFCDLSLLLSYMCEILALTDYMTIKHSNTGSKSSTSPNTSLTSDRVLASSRQLWTSLVNLFHFCFTWWLHVDTPSVKVVKACFRVCGTLFHDRSSRVMNRFMEWWSNFEDSRCQSRKTFDTSHKSMYVLQRCDSRRTRYQLHESKYTSTQRFNQFLERYQRGLELCHQEIFGPLVQMDWTDAHSQWFSSVSWT